MYSLAQSESLWLTRVYCNPWFTLSSLLPNLSVHPSAIETMKPLAGIISHQKTELCQHNPFTAVMIHQLLKGGATSIEIIFNLDLKS